MLWQSWETGLENQGTCSHLDLLTYYYYYKMKHFQNVIDKEQSLLCQYHGVSFEGFCPFVGQWFYI